MGARGLRGMVAAAFALALAALALVCWAPGAWAATGFGQFQTFGTPEGGPGTGPGEFLGTAGLAVNQSSGDVYVVDEDFEEVSKPRVERFKADGAFVSQWPVAAPTQIAVDSSGGESAGDVYVVSSAEGIVEKFDAEGKPVAEIKETEAGVPFAGVSSIAVDAEGNLWVDQASGEVDRFDGAKTQNAFVSKVSFSAPEPEPPATGAFGLDEAEHLYLAQGFGEGCCGVEQRSLSGEDLGRLDPNFASALATDPSSNDVFVIREGSLVDEYNAGKESLGSFGAGSIFCATGIGIAHAAQHVYVADACTNSVHVFEQVTLPTVTLQAPTNITSTGATLHGTVNPEGTEAVNATKWAFEYSTDGGASWTRMEEHELPPGTEPVAVQDTLSTLPASHVQVRLEATDAAGTSTSSPSEPFETTPVPLEIDEVTAQDITPNHASLQADIDPNNSPTTYWFEYGTTTAYGASVPAAQDAEVIDVEEGNTPDVLTRVVQPLYGLAAGTTYHFRVVARNEAGTVHGEDETFTTTTPPAPACSNEAIRDAQRSQYLPDCRAYEMASPPDKNGGDVIADSSRTRAADDGSSADFSSLSAFGDAIGTSSATDYMSVRGPSGWSSHAITPAQAPLTVKQIQEGLHSLYVGPFSDDLSAGVFLGWSPVTNDPDVANVPNIYVRTDLKTPGAGSYQLASPCPLCASTGTPLPPLPLEIITGGVAPFFAGASDDYGHVIFESQQPLTSDAPSGCDGEFTNPSQCPASLYEWDHGTLRVAGVLPDTACEAPPCIAHGSQAGQGAGGFGGLTELTPHTISSDGARIEFTVPTRPRRQGGALYMRVDHTTTVQVNASELAEPQEPQPATYWDASTDGTRVFFTSEEALTQDALAQGGNNLYMYDATQPPGKRLSLINVDRQPADPGEAVTVLGSSADGQFVYFSAVGQLVPGQPVLGTARALYVWHDGTLSYIANTSASDLRENTVVAEWVSTKPTARVTPNGLHLLFSSTEAGPGPTGYDQGSCGDTDLNGGCRELYVYSFDRQRIVCASCNPSGASATASAFTSIVTNESAAIPTWTQNHPLSDDGRRVFFSTAEALVPQDRNGKIDVYEYDVPTGTVHLITSGRDSADSYFMDASSSGNDAFFLTRGELVGSDADNNYDLYDARVAGGFPQAPPPPEPCAGETCQGVLGTAPGTIAPASTQLGPSGNLASPQPPQRGKPATHKTCRKGFVLKRVRRRLRCVRKRKPHRHRHGGHAGARRIMPTRMGN